ncbi:1,4-dihydroxy-2-naphthoate octaprenyltransferase [Psychrobacter lutiphocae]|uniref:1,4-dihydroxy-2-naphthoate octaprenyltransferase n=1 Tax=Psychrobacter lutiphocae TaxID=540500 RepID=UPI000367CCAF|nr:1,4-dihydroxy-2-naphthoate octaprenyltransferase [Psychrobacter lutiphocae]
MVNHRHTSKSNQSSKSSKPPSDLLKAFIQATRPRTFPLAIASIVCGSSLGLLQLANEQSISWYNWLVLALTFWVALALQILSNLANDYGDGVKGTDDLRAGSSPERMLARGQLQAAPFKRLILSWAALSFASGVVLIALGFDNLRDFLLFLAFGIIAIIAAMAYTMGKRPYGYRAMGEVAVLIFFGWLAVLGSAYLQTQQFDPSHLLPATGCGGLAACVLFVNNMRDVDSDKQAGKITLAVILGKGRMQSGYYLLMTLSLLCYVGYAVHYNLYTAIWLLALPLILKHLMVIQSSKTLGSQLTSTIIGSDNAASSDKALDEHTKLSSDAAFADTVLIGSQLKVIVMSTLLINLLFALGVALSYYL